MLKTNPIFVIFRTIILLIGGRAQFLKERVGETITWQGIDYTVFRQVVMKTHPHQPENPAGVFNVWFYTRTTLSQTILMSYATILFFMGLPGFRSKIWMLNEETGEFGGIYEWDTVEQAEFYGRSYAMKLSAIRSIPGKFTTEVFERSLDIPSSSILAERARVTVG